MEILAPVGRLASKAFPAMVDSFAPNCWTPIAGALEQSESAFANTEGSGNKVVLVTDGLETVGVIRWPHRAL